jgi:hypothetical protein
MASRRLTAAQQRERRARILAVVLGGVFVLLCAIQAPRVLHQLHPSHAAAAPAAADSAAAAAETSLLSATGPAAPQVTRLSRFAYRNPFPEVATTTSAAATTPAPTTTSKEAPPTTAPAATTTTAAAPPHAPTVTVPFAPAPTRPGVLLLVAGNRHALARGDAFPKAQPLFRVVGFTAKRLQVRLLTGTLPGGAQVLTLRVKHRVVLRNTSDGTSLALEYLRPAKLALRTAPPKPAQ